MMSVGRQIRRVVYEPATQQGIIADLLDRVMRVVPPRPAHPIHEQWRMMLAQALAKFYSELFFMRAYFKSRAFSDEREWRLLAALDHRKKSDIGFAYYETWSFPTSPIHPAMTNRSDYR
jgi:hypothetical protein